MKRNLFALLLIVILIFSLLSCGHTHTYSDEWEYDESNHWHTATCKHTDKKSGLASHADSDSDGACDVCDYGMTPDAPPTESFNSTATVLTVKGGAGGIVVIVHDDGLIATGNMLDELYREYGLVGDVAMQVNNVSNNSAALSGWQALVSGGRWKVVSHSMTHTWWGTGEGSADRLYSEIVGSQTALRNYFPGERVLTFAYPGFSSDVREHGADVVYSDALFSLVEDTYIGARWYDEKASPTISVGSFDSWKLMNGYFLTTGNIRNGYLTTRLDRAAAGSLEIISLHALTTDLTAPEGGYYMPYVDMETACQLISGYVADGRVWNAHYEDAVMYLREAQSATVSVTGDESALTVTLTDSLDNSIYNFPLTVRITVPDTWAAANMTVGGVAKYLEAKEVNGKWVIDADIVPDGGEAILTPTEKHLHTYDSEWTSDTTHHWHEANCDVHESCNGAVSDRAEHTDTDTDGVCDVCERALFYTVTVETLSDKITLITAGELCGAIGEDVTFTVAVEPDYELWIKSGATLVGTSTALDGKKLYTLKVSAISENTAVSLDVRIDGAYNYESLGNTASSEKTVTVWENDGSYSLADNGGARYVITYKNSADTAYDNTDGVFTLSKYATIVSIKDSLNRESTISYGGVTYGAGGDGVVTLIPSRDWLGITKGFASSKNLEIWPTVRTGDSELAYVFDTEIKIDRSSTGHAISIYYNDGGTDKCNFGFYANGKSIIFYDETYAPHSTGVRVGEWFSLRYELYKDGTVKALVNGSSVYETRITVNSPTSFRLKLSMRDDSQDRNSTVSFKNTRFLKYSQ